MTAMVRIPFAPRSKQVNKETAITLDANEAVARVAHKVNEVIAIYNELEKISLYDEKKLNIVTIKNRLNSGTKDIKLKARPIFIWWGGWDFVSDILIFFCPYQNYKFFSAQSKIEIFFSDKFRKFLFF